MRIKTLFLISVLFLLSGCNLPVRPLNTPTADAIATQVATLLTPKPAATQTAPVAQITMPATATQAAAPSETPVPPTATKAPASVTEAPTISPNDPKSSLGQPAWRDTLETGKNFYAYENENTKARWEDGALLLTGITANGWQGWSLTHSQQPLNFYLEAAFIPQDCKSTDLYGLVFRATDTSGYFFGATCDGKYNLHARNFNDGSDKIIVELTQNASITAGANQTNRLGVLVNGDKISIYANGALLGESTDDTFKDKGYFGAFVAANETPNFTVKMDEISLWKLP